MTDSKRLTRAAILISGLLATQFILYGPSLLGWKILLPLDLLAEAAAPGRNAGAMLPHDRLLSDPVTNVEPLRRFAVSEVRAGRLPLWDPYNYCGAPFLAANQGAVFSPFRLLDYLWPSPWALAWGQAFRALVAGVGAFLFFRRAMHAHFWAATIGAWIWPQCGFLVLWTMWPISASALWLPWIFLAIKRCIRRPAGPSIAFVSLITAFTMLCGHSATGAHVLLASGIYAFWMLLRRWRRGFLRSTVAVLLGWVLGFCLAAPQMLPTLQYMRESLRMVNRIENGSETAPVGLSALPQLVMPWIAGTTRTGWIYLGSDIPLESAIGGYIGLLAVMTLAPFGLVDRRRRFNQFLWLLLALIGAAYVLDIPGVRFVHQVFPLSMLRGNRLIFVTGFALLAGCVAGLDVLLRQRVKRNRWLLAGPTLSLALAGWCVWRVIAVPDLVALKSAPALQTARNAGPEIEAGVTRVILQMMDRFQSITWVYAGLCIGAAAIGLLLWWRPARLLTLTAGLAACAEVLISAWSVNSQSDPSLYHTQIPVLQSIGATEPGRICGVLCLPPMMNRWAGLSDIRGYDAADPLRYLQVMQALAAPESPTPDPSAATYSFAPRYPSGLADFLNLRYLIHRGTPPDPAAARFITPGYYVIENRSVLPRVSVPRSAVSIPDPTARLNTLADPTFDPRQTVILESPNSISPGPTEGSAHITSEIPSRIEIEYDMQSAGMIVLADCWDAGWRAHLNGTPAVVHRANHAFRAVPAPAGRGRLVFTYQPTSFTLGLWLAASAAFLLATLSFLDLRRR